MMRRRVGESRRFRLWSWNWRCVGRWQMPDRRFWSDFEADHCVLVSREPTHQDGHAACPQRLEDWKRFLTGFGIPVALQVHSLQAGQSEPPGMLTVTGLNRELKRIDPDVWQVACKIADLLP